MGKEKESRRRHSIGVVSRLTGLKPDVIRAWERRYAAIEPQRTPTNRRYYTDEQLDRLVMLRQATLSGRPIGQIAQLETEELRELVAADEAVVARFGRPAPAAISVSEPHVTACQAAVESMDVFALRMQLEKSALDLSHLRLIESVVVPLLEQIGKSWEEGDLRIAHEHAASPVIRTFLTSLQDAYVPSPAAPSIVVATPLGQLHEMGALMAVVTAASEGWRTYYVGASLPVEETAAVAAQKGARVIALSIVHPTDDPQLGIELKRLRRLIGDETEILVGGRAAGAYSRVLTEISARHLLDLMELRRELRRLRDSFPVKPA